MSIAIITAINTKVNTSITILGFLERLGKEYIIAFFVLFISTAVYLLLLGSISQAGLEYAKTGVKYTFRALLFAMRLKFPKLLPKLYSTEHTKFLRFENR